MSFIIDQTLKLTSPDLYPHYTELQKSIKTDYTFNSPANIFILLFREIYINSDADYQMNDGTIGASRTNCTYLIAHSFHSAAKIMNLYCIFETEGKRDAVIKMKDVKPITLLFAEWEWDYKDVFGRGKELEKLFTSVRKTKTSSGLLFTYVPENEYPEYLKRVIEYWQSKSKTDSGPKLVLMTVLFNPEKGYRVFKLIRTCIIYNDSIKFWEDQYFLD